MRYNSKQALVADIRAEHDSLCARLDAIPKGRYREPGVWGDAWTVADLVAHLVEWQFMFLEWYDEGLRGGTPHLPAPGYTWSQLASLNRAIWLKHRSRSPALARSDFEAGYDRILRIIGDLSEKQILEPGHFAWTGTHGLKTYLGGSTSSHYRFAMKVLKRWLAGKTVRTASGTRPAKGVKPRGAPHGRR